MNIILVDDETAMLQILRRVLPWQEIGIREVYTARNAGEAKKLFSEKEIDLSLCDIEMPKESGLELIRWVQGLYPDVIHIILTGHPDFNYARSAISLGVYEFLLKPAAFDELERVLRAAVEKRREAVFAERPARVTGGERDEGAVGEVKRYLEAHFNEDITRNEIEKLVHLNRDYINREFKQSTGYTLMEYIQYYRVRMAKTYLRESDMTVSEIGLAVGYDSPAYFAKIFKKRTGMTPVEYRQAR